MTDAEAKQILEVALAHAKGYTDAVNQFDDERAVVVAQGCATASHNTAWSILRSFGYEHEQIIRMKDEIVAALATIPK